MLLPLAAGLGLLTGATAQFVTALAALTMLLGPLVAKALDLALARRQGRAAEPRAGQLRGAGGRVLVIGFGRFGQIVNQVLLAQGIDVTVIDKNVDRIRAAARFGFRVYLRRRHAPRRAARRRGRAGGGGLHLRRRPRGGAEDRRDRP